VQAVILADTHALFKGTLVMACDWFEPRTFWFSAHIFNRHTRWTLLRNNARQGCWNTITGVTVCYTTAPSSLSLPPFSVFTYFSSYIYRLCL